MKHLKLYLPIAAAALLLAGVSGCGGGAGDVPTITVKPKETEAAPSGDGPSTDDSPSDNTTPPTTKDGHGTWKGKVVLTGTLPSLPLPALVAKGDKSARDPAVCGKQAAIPDESLLVQNRGLANVFIYLKKAPKNGIDDGPIEQLLLFDQKACTFKPHAMVVRTGQTITVRNSDPVPHNVKTKPVVGDPFEATLNEGQTGELIYNRSTPIPASAECNFHTWMKAYQLPLDHPYGVVSGADGSFTIPNLPVGTHRFVIWHERSPGRPLNSRFSVKISSDGQVFEKDISIDVAKLK